jgi:hypothetical protein
VVFARLGAYVVQAGGLLQLGDRISLGVRDLDEKSTGVEVLGGPRQIELAADFDQLVVVVAGSCLVRSNDRPAGGVAVADARRSLSMVEVKLGGVWTVGQVPQAALG